MAQDEIRHAAVVAKRRLLSEKALIEPRVHVFQNEILAVARQRPREARRRIEVSLRRLHDAEGDGVAHRLHLRQGVRVRVRNVRAPRYAAHLRVLEGLHDVADGEGIEEAVRIHEDEQLVLRLLRAARHGVALAQILRLLQEADALRDAVGAVIRIRRLQLGDHLLHTLGGSVVGTVVDDDDFELVHGIVLVDAAVDRALNPFLLIEARNDDRHAGRIVGIDGHRAVEHRKQVARQKERRGNDAVEIKPAVELEIDDGFSSHEHDDERDDGKEEDRQREHVALPACGGILSERLLELDAVELLLLPEAAHDRRRQLLHLHLVALGHRAWLDLEGQLHLARKLRLVRLLFQPHEDARRRDVHGARRKRPRRPLDLHGIVDEIALPVLRILLIENVVVGLHVGGRAAPTAVAAMSRRVRHMREQTAILLHRVENLVFLSRACRPIHPCAALGSIHIFSSAVCGRISLVCHFFTYLPCTAADGAAGTYRILRKS